MQASSIDLPLSETLECSEACVCPYLCEIAESIVFRYVYTNCKNCSFYFIIPALMGELCNI